MHLQSIYQRSPAQNQLIKQQDQPLQNDRLVESKGFILSRLRVYLPATQCESEQDLSWLTCLQMEHGLLVRQTHHQVFMGMTNPPDSVCLDLELRGTLAQIRQGLAFLESLAVQIVGKPNPEGDGWDY